MPPRDDRSQTLTSRDAPSTAHEPRPHRSAHHRPLLRAVVAFVVAAWLVGCGPNGVQRVPDEGSPQPLPDDTGSLRVTIDGLPDGLPADVTLSHTGADPVVITGSML